MPLDRESKDRYSLLLVASDMGTIPQQTTRVLTVHVTDVDDHKPVFKRSLVRKASEITDVHSKISILLKILGILFHVYRNNLFLIFLKMRKNIFWPSR